MVGGGSNTPKTMVPSTVRIVLQVQVKINIFNGILCRIGCQRFCNFHKPKDIEIYHGLLVNSSTKSIGPRSASTLYSTVYSIQMDRGAIRHPLISGTGPQDTGHSS